MYIFSSLIKIEITRILNIDKYNETREEFLLLFVELTTVDGTESIRTIILKTKYM